MSVSDYDAFLAAKAQLANAGGFEPTTIPDHLYDFQRDLVTDETDADEPVPLFGPDFADATA